MSRTTRRSSDDVVRGGLLLVTLQAIGMAYVIALREDDVQGCHRALLLLSAVALFDQWLRAHVAVRETSLALLRGGTVAALFFAGIDVGPTEEEIHRASTDAIAAALLVAQARRAADVRVERRAAAEQLEVLSRELHAVGQLLSTLVTGPPSVRTAEAGDRAAGWRRLVVVGVVRFAAGAGISRRAS